MLISVVKLLGPERRTAARLLFGSLTSGLVQRPPTATTWHLWRETIAITGRLVQASLAAS
jgi:hypothetical protein